MKCKWTQMLVVGVLAAAMLSGLTPTASAAESAQVSAQAHIVSAVLARGYANGKAKGVTTTFKPSDHVIHCVVKLNKVTKARMRFTWVAVDAAGMKNFKILDTTLPIQLLDTSHFSASLPRDWPVGKYKADVYMDGKLVRSLPCKVQ